MPTTNPFVIENPVTAIPVVAGSGDLENKKLYAEALLRNPLDPHKAARKAFPNQFELQSFAFSNWQQDVELLQIQDRLVADHGADSFLPTREERLHEIYHRADKCKDNLEFRQLEELAAKIRGLIVKDSTVINNNNQVNNVLQIPQFTDDEAWETSCVEHQQVLLEIAHEQQALEADVSPDE